MSYGQSHVNRYQYMLHTVQCVCAHSFTHSVTLLEKLLWVFMSGVLMVLVGYLTWARRSAWHPLLDLVTHFTALWKRDFVLRPDVAVNQHVVRSLPALRWIIHIFTNSCVTNCVCLQGSCLVHSFSLCPYIPANPSLLPPSLLFGADVLLFLYPPTCFTHTHTCSLSLTELHFGPERESQRTTDEKESLFFFLITLCCVLISSSSFSLPLHRSLHPESALC